MLNNLGSALRSSIKKLISKVIVDKKAIDEFIKEIQRALIVADVDVELVFKLTKKIKERIQKEEKLNRKEQLVRIVYDELVNLLGEGGESLIKKRPYKILLIGLFGAGKTTTAGKLALMYKKKGYKPCLMALDTFRPAAVQQLKQISKDANVNVLANENEQKAQKVVKNFKKEFEKYDIIIADSAGRDALDKELIKEIKEINKELKPDEILLVMPADIGQSARKQAEAFKNTLNITGVILTKLDSTARGGGALTACAIAGAPVKFIGVGEGIKDIELFKPERFVSRLLGMGDLETLLEKAKEELDESKIKDLGERFLSGKFNYFDLYEQLNALNKMGSMSKLLSFIPGISNLKLPVDQLNLQENMVKKFKHIMDSMTREELENPKLLNRSRIERIAKGSGCSEGDVRELIKQFNKMRSVVRKMKGGNLKKLMKRLGIKDLKAFEEMMGGLS